MFRFSDCRRLVFSNYFGKFAQGTPLIRKRILKKPKSWITTTPPTCTVIPPSNSCHNNWSKRAIKYNRLNYFWDLYLLLTHRHPIYVRITACSIQKFLLYFVCKEVDQVDAWRTCQVNFASGEFVFIRLIWSTNEAWSGNGRDRQKQTAVSGTTRHHTFPLAFSRYLHIFYLDLLLFSDPRQCQSAAHDYRTAALTLAMSGNKL